MEKDELDILSEVEVEAEAPVEKPVAEDPVEEPEAEVEEEAQAEPEPEADDTGEDTAPPADDQDEQPNKVPLTAMLDEREKRQEWQRKAEETERKLADMQRQMAELQKPPEEKPDWYEDPDGALRHQTQSIEQRLEQQRLQQSRFFAAKEYGEEVVNEAVAYFDQNPQLSHQFTDEPSPFHAAVEFYKRQKLADEVGQDPEAWRKAEAERIRQEVLAELAEKQSGTRTTPPPSVAKAASAGRDRVSSDDAFDATFGD